MKTISAKAESIVRAAPIAVFNAFVEAETMSKFWFTRRDERLQEGETSLWYVGKAKDAHAIEVRAIEIKKPELIQIDWKLGEHVTHVLWRILDTNDGQSVLTIEESGFKGTEDQIISKALDSTGGFNQVTIALKAYLEHDAIINVVTDHP